MIYPFIGTGLQVFVFSGIIMFFGAGKYDDVNVNLSAEICYTTCFIIMYLFTNRYSACRCSLVGLQKVIN